MRFISRGIAEGRRWDLTGVGLIRSTGGWAAVKALRKEMVHAKNDERILGDGDFVEENLAQSQERYDSRHVLQARGIDVDCLATRVGELQGIKAEQVWTPGITHIQVKARSLSL